VKFEHSPVKHTGLVLFSVPKSSPNSFSLGPLTPPALASSIICGTLLFLGDFLGDFLGEFDREDILGVPRLDRGVHPPSLGVPMLDRGVHPPSLGVPMLDLGVQFPGV